jgi:hypothetical protein
MQKCFELFLVNSIIREYGAVVKRKTAKNWAFSSFLPWARSEPNEKGQMADRDPKIGRFSQLFRCG